MGAGRLAQTLPATFSRSPAVTRKRVIRTDALLTQGLLLLLLYVAFDHGAVATSAQARGDLWLALLGALAAVAGLWSGSLRWRAPRLAAAGLLLLALFALWSAVTLIWSVDAEGTWLEFNRNLACVLVVLLGISLGASSQVALERVGLGFLVVVGIVAADALAQKMLPGVGLLVSDASSGLPRLQEPLGYWNALGLFLALGAPLALVLVTSRERRAGPRLAGIVGLTLMLLAIGLTLSRGGLLALAVGLIIVIAMADGRLRSVMWLGTAALAAMPGLVFGLKSHWLTTAGISLGDREAAGVLLLVITLTSLTSLVVLARTMLVLEQRVQLGPARLALIRRGLAAVAVVLLVGGLLSVATSSRGLTGTASHAWQSFTSTHGSNITDPRHLLSTDSENRWVWWKEAAGAFSDHPVRGWGAGSFPVVHLLYRRDTLSVKQPHSMPLQWLAETGLTGAALVILGLALLMVLAVRRARQGGSPQERMLAVALLAAVASYLVHSLYDWDWDIPAVTWPPLLFLGVLAGSARVEASRSGHAWFRDPPAFPARAAALTGALAALVGFALSAALPSLAGTEANSAIVSAAPGSPAALSHAARSAAVAAGLDPLSDAGPSAEASIALGRGAPQRALELWGQALRRDPHDTQAWVNLAYLEAAQGDQASAQQAAQRALALDPLGAASNAAAVSIAALGVSQSTPPQDSATAAPLP